MYCDIWDIDLPDRQLEYLNMMPRSGFGTAEDPFVENAAIPADIDGAVVPEEDAPVQREEVTSANWMFPTSLAIQVFSIVPGIAGGLAGFVLASKLAKAKSVKASEVLLASGTVALITFAAVFLVRTIDEFE